MFKNLFLILISLLIFYFSTGYSQTIKDYRYVEFPAESTEFVFFIFSIRPAPVGVSVIK